jgi:hypothetical protein
MTTPPRREAGRKQPEPAPRDSTDDLSPSERGALEGMSRKAAAIFAAIVILALLAYVVL